MSDGIRVAALSSWVADMPRTLLDWAKDVAKQSAILRTEPPHTSTKELSEMISAQMQADENMRMLEARIEGLERTNQMWLERDWKEHPGGPR
jgi:hypothetical protein